MLIEIGAGRPYSALIEGDIEDGTPMSGQVAGLITEILYVEEVILSIVMG